jgi:hypothetical protein
MSDRNEGKANDTTMLNDDKVDRVKPMARITKTAHGGVHQVKFT